MNNATTPRKESNRTIGGNPGGVGASGSARIEVGKVLREHALEGDLRRDAGALGQTQHLFVGATLEVHVALRPAPSHTGHDLLGARINLDVRTLF